MTTVLRVALVSFLAAYSALAQDVVSVKSPDGRIEFRLFDGPPNMFTQLPHLAYQVDFNGRRLIDTSYVGFEIANQLPLGQKPGLVDVLRDTVNQAGNPYNEIVANYLQNGSLGRRMTMEARAFNDGVAFRYVVPPSAVLPRMQIESEMTQFAFAKDGDTYPLLVRGFQTGYAEGYSKITLSGIHEESLVALPFLVEQPGVGWAAVTEADLDEYAGMYLRRAEGRAMQAVLSPRVDGSGLAVDTETPLVTPWRVILIADRAEKLIESSIILSLNRATEIEDTSWIQSGKAVRVNARPVTDVRQAIDFAAGAGLEYVLLDAAAGSTEEMAAYAREKKIGLWVTMPWSSAESQTETKFAELAKWGVRGVVIEGMNRDDQTMVAFYHSIAAKAAEHRLMLVFHGAYKPDGLSRTFPNVLTQDAALGSEYAKWGARANPEHNVMLAFSRLLAGPLDYSPGGFNNVAREEFAPSETAPLTLGTRAHQLALFVVFESPLQILAGDVKSYEGEGDVEFIKAVPTTWDSTKALGGETGEYVVLARKRGAEWYLGAITNWDAREIDVPLAFLGAGSYMAQIYSDTADPKSTNVEERRVRASDSLHLKLASGGGTAVRFGPAQ